MLDDHEIEKLSSAARQGKTDAAAQVISLCLPYWMSAARQIIESDDRSYLVGGSVEDPADLVQEAIIKLLGLWSQRKGPQTNTRSYVTAMIRNSYSNILRSPRTREQSMETFELVNPVTSMDVRAVDLSRELEAVHGAFESLPSDYRSVLIAILIERRKPNQLTDEFQRPAPAISSLLARAKQSLFRAVLITQLSEGGAECAKNAQQLPARVHNEVTSHFEKERGISHVRGCDECQRNWRWFAAISTAFGVIPVLILVQISHGAVPALALSNDVRERETDREQSPNRQSSLSEQVRATTSPPAHTATEFTKPSAVSPHVPATAPKDAPGAVPTARAAVHRLTAAFSSTAVLGAGLGLLAVAAFAFTGAMTLSQLEGETVTYEDVSSGENPYGAGLNVSLSENHGSTLRTIHVAFSVKNASAWVVQDVVLGLSPGASVQSASQNLHCDFTDVVTCIPLGQPGVDGNFEFDVIGSEDGTDFSLKLTGEVDGHAYVGTSIGRWERGATD